VAQIEFGQWPRRHLRGDEHIDQADRELAERKQDDERDEPELEAGSTVTMRVGDEAGHRHGGTDRNRPEVSEHRVSVDEARETLRVLGRVTDVLLEAEAAARDQVVADVMRAVVRR
jgi:hypothetical protein